MKKLIIYKYIRIVLSTFFSIGHGLYRHNFFVGCLLGVLHVTLIAFKLHMAKMLVLRFNIFSGETLLQKKNSTGHR